MRHYLFCLLCLWVISCRKDDSKQPFGFSKIYMPQAILQSGGVNNQYAVPSGTDSSTYNYAIDSGRLNIFLGASLSGPSTGPYTVAVQVDNDTIAKLFAAGAFDTSVYKLMPAAMYTLPSQLTVASGARAGSFNLSLDIPSLKASAFVGKYLLLAVRIANPTQYSLDTSLSETIVVVNVNSLVIGPAVNVTSQYILNPGNPFVASAMSGSRWGSLEDWTTNPAATSHNGQGGFSIDGDGPTMDLESGWGSPQIYNGKIWQTIQLPAGTYGFDPSGGNWKWQGTLDPTYVVVAPGLDTLPDYSNVSQVPYQLIVNNPQPYVTFQLTAPSKVSVGIVMNYIKSGQGFKSTQVTLYNYPKHL
ncbi:DUF5013 domain-containing protein [Dinghuibacter silviterrae]|uniref:Uncharacterized protein DUF1735 n=1 Tax=Dinghuibacter silviterrae TaxID=1539049 RepID=A0A4V3GM52_9BACT|nr:DUF5013 domain-containing protein [Dinghuibacter silviterrae]TDX02043.1 uncharacterized protein DUF1735 [Dinghuibacter silviterrae]